MLLDTINKNDKPSAKKFLSNETEKFAWFLIETPENYTISTVAAKYNILSLNHDITVKAINVSNELESNDALWNIKESVVKNRFIIHSASSIYDGGDIALSGNNVIKDIYKKTKVDASDYEWSFTPSYIPNIELSGFRYLTDPQKVIESKKKIEFLDTHYVIVDKKLVGSKVSRIYEKSITDTFTYGFDEKIGLGISVSGSIDTPLAKSKLEVSVRGSFGSSQEWTKTTEKKYSSILEIVPTHNGTFQMQGWVDFVKDINLPFSSLAKLTLRGTRINVNGYLEYDRLLDVDAIMSYLKNSDDFISLKIIDKNYKEGYVTLNITGNVKASFGVGTRTSFKCISN